MKKKYSVEVMNKFEALLQEVTNQDLSEGEMMGRHCGRREQSTKQAVTEVVPKKERRKHQEWITNEILHMM